MRFVHLNVKIIKGGFMNIKFIMIPLCFSLVLPLTAQQPAQQSQPTLMQKIKKEWKKVAAFGATAAATIGTAIYLGVNQYRYSKMTPLQKADLLPNDTIPIYKPFQIKTPQEIQHAVVQVREMLQSQEVRAQIQETDTIWGTKMSLDNITIENVDVNAIRIDTRGSYIYPLHLIGLAAELGNPKLTQLLIDAGSKVNHGNAGDGQSALDIATVQYVRSRDPRRQPDYLETIKILVNNNACFQNVINGFAWADNPVLYKLFTENGFRGNSRLVRKKVGSIYEVHSLRCEDY